MSLTKCFFLFFRAFFRRSVDKAHTYHCQEGRNCFIDITTRRNCQYCRFQKCLNSGMKTNWVLSKDERRDRLIKKRENAAQRAAKLMESIEKPVEMVPTQGTFLPWKVKMFSTFWSLISSCRKYTAFSWRKWNHRWTKRILKKEPTSYFNPSPSGTTFERIDLQDTRL